jgi:hypothetical protein
MLSDSIYPARNGVRHPFGWIESSALTEIPDCFLKKGSDPISTRAQT